jgi:hypothetical protein
LVVTFKYSFISIFITVLALVLSLQRCLAAFPFLVWELRCFITFCMLYNSLFCCYNFICNFQHYANWIQHPRYSLYLYGVMLYSSWCIIRIDWVFRLCPSPGILKNTIEHNLSETGSVSVLRREDGRPLLGWVS